MKVQVADLVIGDRLRQADPAKVATLKGSMATEGLLMPVRVRAKGGKLVLVAGLHRVEAAKALGWSEIDATEQPDYGSDKLNELHDAVAEIDENVMRNDLTIRALGRQLLRRGELKEMIEAEVKAAEAKARAEAAQKIEDARKRAQAVAHANRDAKVASKKATELSFSGMQPSDVALKIKDLRTVKDVVADPKSELPRQRKLSAGTDEVAALIKADKRTAQRHVNRARNLDHIADVAGVSRAFADDSLDGDHAGCEAIAKAWNTDRAAVVEWVRIADSERLQAVPPDQRRRFRHYLGEYRKKHYADNKTKQRMVARELYKEHAANASKAASFLKLIIAGLQGHGALTPKLRKLLEPHIAGIEAAREQLRSLSVNASGKTTKKGKDKGETEDAAD